MQFKLAALIVTILILHIFIMFSTWFSNRCKPVIAQLSLFQTESLRVHKIAKRYQNHVEVPQELLLPPKSKIVKQAKKVEIRLLLEATVVVISGMIPSGLVALYIT